LLLTSKALLKDDDENDEQSSFFLPKAVVTSFGEAKLRELRSSA
jgi:hypothetical protein